jgi:hypothetical protein
MARITADNELRTKLLNFAQDIDICDESDYVLGRLRTGAQSNGLARIKVDYELESQLLHFEDDVEICDASGTILARVEACAPWSDPEQWEPVEAPSPEDVQRSLNSPGRNYTTAEILQKLKDLDVSG